MQLNPSSAYNTPTHTSTYTSTLYKKHITIDGTLGYSKQYCQYSLDAERRMQG